MRKFLLLFLLSFGLFLQAQVSIGNDEYNLAFPLYALSNVSYGQSIYPKNAIGVSGDISGIEYQMSSTTSHINGFSSIEVYMKNVDATQFDTADDLILEDLTLVFSGTPSLNNDNKMVLDFSQPFAYDNNYNLLVVVRDMDIAYGSSATKFVCSTAADYATYRLSDFLGTSPIDPTQSGYSTELVGYLPNIVLNGLTPAGDSQVPNCTHVTSPYDGETNISFLPRIDYEQVSNANQYFVSLGTTPLGTDIYDMYDNEGENNFYVNYELEPNTQYYVTVYPSNAAGTNTTCTSSSFTTGSTVANDNCDTAEAIATLPYTNSNVDGEYATAYDGNVVCNNIDNDGSPFELRDGLWYAIEGDGSDIEVTVTPTSLWNPSLAIKESCSTGDCIVTAEAGGLGDEVSLSFKSEAGRTYLLAVGYVGGLPIPEGTFDIHVSSNLSTQEVDFSAIKVFPNPTQDVVMVQGIKAKQLTLFDINGSMVHQSLNSNEISLKGKASGTYLLQITTIDGNEITQKVIKK